MFKNKKIKKFIEKYSEDFSNHNYAELADFLSGVEDIEIIISKINKLSKEDADYVLSTIIKYKEFNFDQDTVDLILSHKLDLIKKFGTHCECPNLDRIYYALEKNRNLYKSFVQDYKENHITDYEDKFMLTLAQNGTLTSYSSVLTNYCNKVHNILNKCNSTVTIKKYLLALSPRNLEFLLAFNNEYTVSEPQYRKKVFNSLVKNDTSTLNAINSLSFDNFQAFIRFLFSFHNELDKDQVLESKLKLVPEILSIALSSEQNKDSNMKLLLHNLKALPDYYIISLAEDMPFNINDGEWQSEFLDYLSKKEGCQLIEYINESHSPDLDEEIYQLLISKEFRFLSTKQKELIMEHLPGRKKTNLEIYQAQKEFLLKSNSYLLELDPIYLEQTLKFIEDDDDIEILKTKEEALGYVQEELENHNISLDIYQKYLDILEKNLEGKSNKEKRKYIKARSRYFEEHSLTDFINSFKFNESNQGLTELLETENSIKKMKQYYSFAKSVDCYDSSIADMAVERLASIPSKKNTKMFVEFITNPYFVNSDLNRQKTLLNLFPIESTTQSFDQELEVVIPDLSYVKDVVLNSDTPVEFKNNKTGMKVFVKTTVKNSKNS